MEGGDEGWVWQELDSTGGRNPRHWIADLEGEQVAATEGEQVAAMKGGQVAVKQGEQVAAMEGEQVTTVEGEQVDGDKAEPYHAVEDTEMEAVMAEDGLLIHHSICEGYVYPPVCNKCHVIGDVSLFRCYGCSLPVQKVGLPTCNVCGRDVVTSKYWCKDCSRTYGVNKDGVCFVCHRRPADFVDDDTSFVPDSAMDS